jgi:hypothetical protein
MLTKIPLGRIAAELAALSLHSEAPLPLLQVAVHPVDLVLLVDLVKVVPLRPLMPLTRDIPTVVVDGGITGRFGRKSG